MASPLETYRVSAYNTSKFSENKIHDDAVARKFGFSGGLVPGVDVFAYMVHLPVAKWGRAFLERGLIEARFVKPVYDGEIAHVSGEESNGVLSSTRKVEKWLTLTVMVWLTVSRRRLVCSMTYWPKLVL